MSSARGTRNQRRGMATGRGTRGRGGQNITSGRPHTRQMELIASVSRSSGLEKGGDTLKDKNVQEEYRKFIQEKLENVLQKYHRRLTETEAEKKHRIEAQENVLILFRKLREGVSSTNRRGPFALEVYETSLFLAIIFDSPRHASAIVSHLIPDIYVSCPSPQPNIIPAILVSLMYHLLASYPSQGLFHQHLDSIPRLMLPETSDARKFIVSLAADLRSCRYASIDRETQQSTVLRVLGQKSQSSDVKHLSILAIFAAVDNVRAKARETAWVVMRAAYRELACHAESMNTRSWLERSLCLQSVVSDSSTIPLDLWLEQQRSSGRSEPRKASRDVG